MADRPTQRELEVTPEMIEAGVGVLYDSGAIENPLHEADRDLARKVFLKMHRHRTATSAS
jgi:hypothetical protein